MRSLNDGAMGKGPVVYWCTSARRMTWNHALDHAAARAQELGVGLIVLEPLRCDYPHASDRFHAAIIAGMQDNAATCHKAGIPYHPVIERSPGETKGMLTDVAKGASLIVADDHPGFFFPRMLAAAARLPVRVEAVDGCSITPHASLGKAFPTAYGLRRVLQKRLPGDLQSMPGAAPPEVDGDDAPWQEAWPASDIAGKPWEALPIDHDVPPVGDHGETHARRRLLDFVAHMDGYVEANHPDAEASSGLSPALHFGHISVHETVARILADQEWNPGRLGTAKGQRAGWWGLSEGAEAFLDQVITWRDVGHLEARYTPHYDQYRSLPDWAKATLEAHAADLRHAYSDEALEAAATDDAVWNAAQRQLLEDGIIHNYLRMVWGKNILAWSKSPKDALRRMFHLNDKYALDGRDPNSVSGIMWCLGRYDRAWGPEREIYGKVRYMTSQNTLRKLRMAKYMQRFQHP